PGPALRPQLRGAAGPGRGLPAVPAEESVAAVPPRLRRDREAAAAFRRAAGVSRVSPRPLGHARPAGAAEAEAAVHHQLRPGDVVGVVRAEKRGRAADILRGTEPAPRQGRAGPGDHLAAEGGVLPGGVDPA